MHSNNIYFDKESLPRPGEYRYDGFSLRDIKVIELLIGDIFNKKEDTEYYIQENIAKYKIRFILAIQALHPEKADIYESLNFRKNITNSLVINILDYDEYAMNGLIQIAINTIIELRSPDYFFNLLTTQKRIRQGFKTQFHQLEYMRHFSY